MRLLRQCGWLWCGCELCKRLMPRCLWLTFFRSKCWCFMLIIHTYIRNEHVHSERFPYDYDTWNFWWMNIIEIKENKQPQVSYNMYSVAWKDKSKRDNCLMELSGKKWEKIEFVKNVKKIEFTENVKKIEFARILCALTTSVFCS